MGCTNSKSAHEAPENLRRHLKSLIANENWNAITQMLKVKEEEEGQQEQDTTITTGTTRHIRQVRKIFKVLLSLKKDLPLILLRERNDEEEANALLVMLIRLGGRKFVMQKVNFRVHYREYHRPFTPYLGMTLLNAACGCNASTDVISLLVDMGGKALFMKKYYGGWNPLYYACHKVRYRASYSYVWEYTELLKTYDKTPLQRLIAQDIVHYWWMNQERRERLRKKITDNAAILINKGIELQIEGEYGIGGLFASTSSTQKVQDQIYENWDIFVLPALEQVITLPHNRHLPILQATIINNAPPDVITSTVNQFTASINAADSSSKYPIDIAAHHGLAWDDGMKGVVERSDTSLFEREDASSGLLPFMVAAVGGKNSYDIGTVFHMIKKCPIVVARK